MRRTFDDDLINSFIENDPAFFKIKNAKSFPNIYFLHEKNIGLFLGTLIEDVMRLHACILPSARGKEAIRAGKDCIKWVFDNTKATTIQTKADITKKHLLIFNALLLNRVKVDENYVYYEVLR